MRGPLTLSFLRASVIALAAAACGNEATTPGSAGAGPTGGSDPFGGTAGGVSGSAGMNLGGAGPSMGGSGAELGGASGEVGVGGGAGAPPGSGGAGGSPGGSGDGAGGSASTGTGGASAGTGNGGASAGTGNGGDSASGAGGLSAGSGGQAGSGGKAGGFVHPGLLHSDEDFARMKTKVDAQEEPWLSGFERLVANSHSSLSYAPRPTAIVYRGADGTHPENYAQLFNDAAAAYATALRWKISGDAAYADKSVEILDAWAAVLTEIAGTSDRFLAAGFYGYEMANAAEVMRTYSGWPAADFERFKTMMLTVFYPMNHDFLVRHNDACISHYWANWDLSNMASILAIGVLVDDRAIYDEAIEYFKNGAGNGSIGNAVYYVHPGNLGQWQESGRDQGHNVLGIGLMGPICEMAYKQGDDLYGYAENRFLAGAEYVASYNLANTVPYLAYDNCDNVNQTVISEAGRGNVRPIWELVYNHYVVRRGLSAPYTTQFAEQVRPEGGGGDYGPNSGGYDQLGYGTLTFTLEP